MVTVELGTWRGASAIALARTVRQWGGVVYCVDTWMGDVNGGTIPGRPSMLLECAANIIAAGVAASVRLIPALTVDAASWWPGRVDFLYIDADHREASVRLDLTTWWPKLRPGGLIAGDDYDNPLYPGVTKAWNDFERVRGWTLERYATPHTNPPGMRLIYGVI